MITVAGLSFTYPGQSKPALDDIHFSIQDGEIFGFLGPSGAGKTTCQKILFKVLPNYQGQIKIDGKALNDWSAKYFEKIGVGFELPNHYEKLTAKENLDLFAGFYPTGSCDGMLELLDLVGLTDDMHRPVASYSKGMKMRLNFVRALMHDPDILFFDEPTSGLDPTNAQLIKDHIKSLAVRGKTIFITTHNMFTADQLCDRVSFLVNGKVILTESPENLKIKYGKNLVTAQLQSGEEEVFPLSDIGKNRSFLNFIQSGQVTRIQSQEATLEQVFIEVTGTALLP